MGHATTPAGLADTDVRMDFRRYLGSRIVSVAGTLVSVVALPVLVYQLTGSAGWTSAVAVAGALPYLLFGLIAGTIADRVQRRRLMIGVELATAALLASIPVAWALEALVAGHVLAVSFAVQALFVFFDAANFGALPTLVGKERITAAFSTLFGATTAVELIVPPLAGLAVAVIAPAPLIALNAVTAVASALLIAAIIRPLSTSAESLGGASGSEPVTKAARAATGAPEETTTGTVRTQLRSIRSDIAAGLAFVWRHRVVRLLTLAGATHAAAAGAWVAMLVPFADQVLGIAPSGDPRLAALFACWGVGGVVAARLVPPLSRRLGHARLALIALPCSLLLAIGTLATSFWVLAVVSATCWGLAHSVVVLNAITYRQLASPDHMQARVNTTARMLAWGVGQPAGAGLAGVVAVTGVGPRGGIGAGAVLLAIGVAVVWLAPTLRREANSATPGASPSHELDSSNRQPD